MEKIINYIKHKFKNKLPQEVFDKYCLMGEFLDEQDEKAFGYNANDAYQQFKIINGLRYLNNTPTLDDWKNFFSDSIINDLLLNKTLQSKKGELRKWINNLDLERDRLDLKDVKALDSLKSMIDNSDKYENNVVYVQYTCPIRYGNHNNEEIVERFKYQDDK